MKKIVFLFLLMNALAVLSLSGQSAGDAGMNFQALARDASGKVLSNQMVGVRIAFSSKEGVAQTYYAEVHQVRTDDLGLFNLVVGEGEKTLGQFSGIPWQERQIWMDVELQSVSGTGFELMNSSQLRAVPYAFHAETANQLLDDLQSIELGPQKNQSIHWTTSGNNETSPETHFVGTRDDLDLIIKTNNIERVNVTNEGQVQITGGVSGPDTQESSYPVVIQGSKQGIHIKVDSSRSTENNFFTFGDDKQFAWGRVQGMTFPELEQTWQYQLKVATFALQAAGLVNAIVAFGIMAAGAYVAGSCSIGTLIFAFCSPGYFIEGSAFIASVAVLAIQAAALGVEADKWSTNIRLEIGVAYQSGNGDYAEWLERNPEVRDLQFAEIVGVKGGKVSLNTQDADHVMVISTRPIVLGNAPQPQEEHLYEKVAFLGQVPVRVAGKVEKGDYILPSGNFDGMGVAVNPGQMHIADFARVVGVAWEAAGDNPLNIIKIGVGLNSNDLAPKVEEISGKVDNIIAYLEGKEPLRGGSTKVSGMPLTPDQLQGSVATSKLFSDEEFDQMIDSDQAGIRKFYADLEKQLQDYGAKISDSPELETLFRDPVSVLKKLRRDPTLNSNWAEFDHWMIKSRK